MKLVRKYVISYGYGANFMATEHIEYSNEKAKAFEEWYKTKFIDCNKWFITTEYLYLKILGLKLLLEEKDIRKWCEE